MATVDYEGASAVSSAGGVQVAARALGEPALPVLRIAASVLADVAKHAPQLGDVVTAAGAADALVPLLSSRDPVVRSQAARALAHLAKWAAPGADGGGGGGAPLPAEAHLPLVALVGDADEAACQHAATCVRAASAPLAAPTRLARAARRPSAPALMRSPPRLPRTHATPPTQLREVARQGERQATKLVEAQVLPALLGALLSGRGSPLPAAQALGIIGGYSSELAGAVLACGAVPVLAQGLRLSSAPHVRAAVARALGAIAAKSADAALAAAEAGCISALLALAAKPPKRAGRARAQAAADAADGGAGAAEPTEAEAAVAALSALAPQLGAKGAYEQLCDLFEEVRAPAKPAPRCAPGWAQRGQRGPCVGRARGSAREADTCPSPSHAPPAQALGTPGALAAALAGLAALFAASEEKGRQQAHFIAAGHMRALQALRAGAEPGLRRAIDAFNGTYPAELIEQLQPGYEQGLLDRIDR